MGIKIMDDGEEQDLDYVFEWVESAASQIFGNAPDVLEARRQLVSRHMMILRVCSLVRDKLKSAKPHAADQRRLAEARMAINRIMSVLHLDEDVESLVRYIDDEEEVN